MYLFNRLYTPYSRIYTRIYSFLSFHQYTYFVCIHIFYLYVMACSMVGARLDYCNSILYGTSAGNLGRIQRVINTLARVVSGARKRDHITPVLADLHWLPIASRI